jgi:hypothetical protein
MWARRAGSLEDGLHKDTRLLMLDITYIALTVAFFALMLAYVRGCEKLGQRQQDEERAP